MKHTSHNCTQEGRPDTYWGLSYPPIWDMAYKLVLFALKAPNMGQPFAVVEAFDITPFVLRSIFWGV